MFVFVILHYQAFKETVSEVEHIINELVGEKRIVIVDNASPNGSGVKLKKHFVNDDNIDVILNDENSGYAKGNNLGIAYALNRYNPNFIVLANNDIGFRQNDFCDLVRQSFKKQKFDLLGPDILVPETGIHQNPKKTDEYTVSQVREINQHSKKLLKQNVVNFAIRSNLKKIVSLRKLVLKARQNNTVLNNIEQDNVVLHGSLLIFSKQFFDKFDVPFDSGTFFYFETEILDKKMRTKNMLAKFDPHIVVYHHQNTSTRHSFKSATERQKFQLTNMIKSTQRFIDLFG
ncbi:MAG: glycosyltransferase [Leuconostoc citreum]